MNTIHTLAAMLTQFQADFIAKEAELMAACEVANHGLKPTVDANGRLHAPCAGYIFNDSIYGAGEYLSDEGMREVANHSVKVKVKESSISMLSNVRPVGVGSRWTENGDTVCYVYINCLTQSQKDAIEKAFPTNKTKTLVLESEAIAQGLQIGKSFKLNMQGVANAWAMDNGSGCYFECYLEDSGLSPLLKIERTKAGKTRFDHPYKGQMVAYHYNCPQAL